MKKLTTATTIALLLASTQASAATISLPKGMQITTSQGQILSAADGKIAIEPGERIAIQYSATVRNYGSENLFSSPTWYTTFSNDHQDDYQLVMEQPYNQRDTQAIRNLSALTLVDSQGNHSMLEVLTQSQLLLTL